ncbi:pre-rRNA-processing protein PNO1 [Batrachochytrium salamandrivorans]|nr:pre-rRNA-processing protein PNO1 [Batrachochytrium salamandrivorans]
MSRNLLKSQALESGSSFKDSCQKSVLASAHLRNTESTFSPQPMSTGPSSPATPSPAMIVKADVSDLQFELASSNVTASIVETGAGCGGDLLEEGEDEEEDNPNSCARFESADTSTQSKNSLLAVGYKHDRSFCRSRQPHWSFKHTDDQGLEFSTTINNVGTMDGTLFSPRRVMLHEQESSMLLMNPDDKRKIFRMDLERGKVIEEWKVDDDMDVNEIIPDKKIDPRLAGNKRVEAQSNVYKTSNQFSVASTTGNGELAVASDKGDIRLYNKLNIHAKTLLQVLHGWARMFLAPARFNTGDSLEKTIITSTGPYVITWNFRQVKLSRSGKQPNTPSKDIQKMLLRITSSMAVIAQLLLHFENVEMVSKPSIQFIFLIMTQILDAAMFQAGFRANEIRCSVVSEKPDFPALSRKDLMNDSIKKRLVKIYTPLVEHMKLQVRMNPKAKAVEIQSCSETEDIGAVQKGADFVKAYGLGFEVDDALALLRLEDLYVDTFEIKDVKTLHGENLSRAIGRIVGKDGKTRFTIENVSRTRIVVADCKIHILGSFQNIKIARDTIVSLILGSSPGKVYSQLRSISSRMKERF